MTRRLQVLQKYPWTLSEKCAPIWKRRGNKNHHRGEMIVYLRATGNKVPGFTGLLMKKARVGDPLAI